MAGSKGVKNSRGKGKSQSNKSETINKKPDVSISKLDLAQSSNIPDALNTSTCPYTEKELTDMIYTKLEWLYATAKDWLLKLGYSAAEVETAILSAGDIHGQMDILNNILTNSIIFIEKRAEPTIEAFKDMGELYKAVLEKMVGSVLKSRPDMLRFDAMRFLLSRKWCCAPSVTRTNYMQSGSCGNSSHSKSSYSAETIRSVLNADPSPKKDGIMKRINFTPELESYFEWNVLCLADDIQRKFGAPVITEQALPSVSGRITEGSDIVSSDILTSCEACPDEPTTAQLLDLLKTINDLQEKVQERKAWAEKKMMDSATRLSKDFLELKLLRLEMADKEKMMNDILCAEKGRMSKINEIGQILQNINFRLSSVNDYVSWLKTQNARIRADTEAFKLNGAESEREVADILKRERKCLRKVSDFEKQISNVQSQCVEEKQRVLQLELDLLQSEKEAEEAEVKWRQEIKEKEHMFALVAEETRTAEIHKANSSAELLKLRQKMEIDSQLARDDCQRLEDELSRLRISQQMPDVRPDDGDFWYNYAVATSSQSSAPIESSERSNRHWMCMMCLENEVSMVFLPCTHQVVCFPCHERNLNIAGAQCPYCHRGIDESIRVYGPSS